MRQRLLSPFLERGNISDLPMAEQLEILKLLFQPYSQSWPSMVHWTEHISYKAFKRKSHIQSVVFLTSKVNTWKKLLRIVLVVRVVKIYWVCKISFRREYNHVIVTLIQIENEHGPMILFYSSINEGANKILQLVLRIIKS